MARQKKAEPDVVIPDLHPVNDGFVQSYKATWTEQGLTAHLELDVVDIHHWQHGQYLKDAYELVSLDPTTLSGRSLGPVQEEIARVLQRKLRERVLDLMKVAGWRRVADTRAGQPIYQYRPAPRRSTEPPTAPAQHTVLEQESGIAPRDLEAEISVQGKQLNGQRQTKVYAVYGSKEAKESGREPAFTRQVVAKIVPFRCAICEQNVTELHYPGQKPSVCSNPACKREAIRLRVQKSREKHKKAKTV